ncbi:MAG TPA: ComEC/Rec2 family competence protein, partial [Acidimicrobiales bacterium]|nr:ComEC/Rec2 family competence protein [Acidimicrobiales bacterium]
MSDRWAVILAVVTGAAALAAVDGHLPRVPLAAGLIALGVAWLLGRLGRFRPEVLVLAAALLAVSLAQRSLDGLAVPLDTGPVRAEVTLVGDPVPDSSGGAAADVRLNGRRLAAYARNAAAASLDDRLMGERIAVVGTVRPPGDDEARARHRHLAGRLEIETVTGWRTGDPVTRAANGLRRTLAEGATSLPERHRSLLAGVTLGDDRHQPADMTDAFQAAGLTHLLAVSGQNVAFALVIVAPLLSRLRFGPRLAATLGVLAGFALLTRCEPSVLRATAMASVAAVGTAVGRPASTLRALALGVAGMVLIDPLLVTSLGFRLSVAGAAGIVVGAVRLAAALPGPRWVAAPLSVTLAAQIAVAPLLVAAFGDVPVAAIPANLLAVPVAGPLMVWGLTAGLIAGVVGGPLATALHVPSRVLLAWLDGVATSAAGWPLGRLGPLHLALLAAAAAAVWVLRTRPPRPAPATAGSRRSYWQVALGGAGPMAVLVLAVAAGPAAGVPTGATRRSLGAGATLWQAGGDAVVELDGRAREVAVIGALRSHRVGYLRLVALRTDARAAAAVAAAVHAEWPDAAVVAPGPGAPATGTEIPAGGLLVTVTETGPARLTVEVSVPCPPACTAVAVRSTGTSAHPRRRRRSAPGGEVAGLLARDDRHQLGPAAQSELPVDALQVVVDGLNADEQLVGGVAVGGTVADDHCHPQLRRCQPRVEGRPGSAGLAPQPRRPLAPGPGADPVEDRPRPGDVGGARPVAAGHPALAPGQQGAGLLERRVHFRIAG